MTSGAFPMEGGCTCRRVRYRMTTQPMLVHCCHCRWCQRETGASFALNALIESDRVEVLAGTPEVVDTPSVTVKDTLRARVEGASEVLENWMSRVRAWMAAGVAAALLKVTTRAAPLAPPETPPQLPCAIEDSHFLRSTSPSAFASR